MLPCELERGHNEILDAAHRPSLRALGDDAIRFSSMPSLGGTAAIVEFVRGRRAWTYARTVALSGHPLFGWTVDERRMFSLSRREYDALAAGVDAALASYRPSTPVDLGNGTTETIVCTDGPGFLTERVAAGAVATLAGSCPPERDRQHANRLVAALVVRIVCRHLGAQAVVDLGLARHRRDACAAR